MPDQRPRRRPSRPEPAENADALEQLVMQNRDGLVRALVVRTGDRALSEELAQEAFAKVWAKWGAGADDFRPRGLLYKIAFDLAASSWRRRLAHRRAVERLRQHTPRPEAVPTDDVLSVRRAVASLPRRQAEVVALRYFADLSVAETAAVLGIRPGTVKAHTNRAAEALRHRLGNELVDQGGS